MDKEEQAMFDVVISGNQRLMSLELFQDTICKAYKLIKESGLSCIITNFHITGGEIHS